jgi:ATP-dependent Clp protease ATP-binding subunit ClpA
LRTTSSQQGTSQLGIGDLRKSRRNASADPFERKSRLELIQVPEETEEELDESLISKLTARVVGQAHAMEQIVPYVQMHQAGLAPEGRPAGVFLLLGPTGTGKTRTVEALADVLHGNEKHLLRVDCGEFQMEHEVAKLIGAPPGYLGHRETPPMLTQTKLNAATSDNCDLSLVLFDEIEKAAPSMTRLLLGVLDKAALRLGDNTTVNFERTLIFLTSNIGARELRKEVEPDFGFEAMTPAPSAGASERQGGKLDRIGAGAVRRKFPPEFVNRLDAVITYRQLGGGELVSILDQQLEALERHIEKRLDDRAFSLQVEESARAFLLEKGTSTEFGARELKRTILRSLTQPLAALIAKGAIEPGTIVRVSRETGAEKLTMQARAS